MQKVEPRIVGPMWVEVVQLVVDGSGHVSLPYISFTTCTRRRCTDKMADRDIQRPRGSNCTIWGFLRVIFCIIYKL